MNNLRMIWTRLDDRERDEPEVTDGSERVRTPRQESADLKVEALIYALIAAVPWEKRDG
jgi:hypothetical protein